MQKMGETDREKPLFNVNQEIWIKHNCVYCHNKKSCKLYIAIQKKVEPEDFTANQMDCPWLRYK